MDHKQDVIGIVKEWVSPTLIAIIGIFIWRDLSELRDDVKYLITQQTTAQIKIETLEVKVGTLERDVSNLKYMFYSGNRDAKVEENSFSPVPEYFEDIHQ